MGKLEKLKKVNVMLDKMLVKLETHMFIENIGDIKDKKIDKEKPLVVVVEPKQ